MDRRRKDEIEARTDSILKSSYGTEKITPPINLQKIVEGAGLVTKEVVFEGQIEVAGAYNQDQKTIYVAKDDYFPRQLFTISHELGHFFLHSDKKTEVFLRTDFIKAGSNGEKTEEEKEADCFAANLLMPKELVKSYWLVLKSVEQMASVFGTSQEAMRWRLINLGILQYDHE